MKALYLHLPRHQSTNSLALITLIFCLFLFQKTSAQKGAETPPVPILILESDSYHANDVSWDWSVSISPTDPDFGLILERSFNSTDNFRRIYVAPRREIRGHHDIELSEGCGTYYYRARTINEYGTSAYSNVIVANSNLRTPIRYRINTLLTNASSITLDWEPGDIYRSGFRLMRAERGSEAFVEIANLDRDSRSYTDNSIVAARHYTYRLYAYTSDCTSEYVSVTGRSGIPITRFPLVLSLKRLFKFPIMVQWNELPTTYTHWIIERSDYKEDQFKEIGKVMGIQLSFEDTKPLEKGISYYRVIAMDGDKMVAISKEVSSEGVPEEVKQESTVYPNPFKDSFKLTAAKAAFIKDLKLLSEKGNEEAIEWKQLDEETLEVAVKETLPEGTYYLHIHRSDSKEVEKVRLVREK